MKDKLPAIILLSGVILGYSIATLMPWPSPDPEPTLRAYTPLEQRTIDRLDSLEDRVELLESFRKAQLCKWKGGIQSGVAILDSYDSSCTVGSEVYKWDGTTWKTEPKELK